MIHKVRKTVEQYHMLDVGDCVVIGVSGGADSMALLMVLKELQQEYALDLRVVHVNHMLRKEAENEEAYVRAVCESMQIPCRVCRKDIAAYARELNCSVEDAGRLYRYSCFEEQVQEVGLEHAKVAVAHHMNDRAETMIFHMIRGTGLKGLHGIPAVRREENRALTVIRPFYQVTRQEIEEYLKTRGIAYCTDASNACNDYSRNRIRNQLLPELTEINHQAVVHMAALSEQAAEYWNYAEAQAIQYEQQHGIQNRMEIQSLLEQPELLQRHLIYRRLVDVSGHAKDWEEKHVRMVRELAEKESGKYVVLPYQVRVVHNYEWLEFACTSQQMGDESELLAAGQRNTEKHRDYLLKQTEPIRIDSDTQISVEHIGKMVCKLLNRTSELEISKKTYTKMLDYDTIDDTLYLRNPMQEDYMIVTKQGAHKKVSRIFIDEKIPRDERERMLVLAAGHHVIWIPGIRISESVKITQGTERILYLDFIGMQ